MAAATIHRADGHYWMLRIITNQENIYHAVYHIEAAVGFIKAIGMTVNVTGIQDMSTMAMLAHDQITVYLDGVNTKVTFPSERDQMNFEQFLKSQTS